MWAVDAFSTAHISRQHFFSTAWFFINLHNIFGQILWADNACRQPAHNKQQNANHIKGNASLYTFSPFFCTHTDTHTLAHTSCKQTTRCFRRTKLMCLRFLINWQCSVCVCFFISMYVCILFNVEQTQRERDGERMQ